jgi:hypothetical protein
MKKLSKILVLGLLCITLSSCDMITYFDCKKSLQDYEGYSAGQAAKACKGK